MKKQRPAEEEGTLVPSATSRLSQRQEAVRVYVYLTVIPGLGHVQERSILRGGILESESRQPTVVGKKHFSGREAMALSYARCRTIAVRQHGRVFWIP